jgi:hypothetical protein
VVFIQVSKLWSVSIDLSWLQLDGLFSAIFKRSIGEKKIVG